MFVLSPDSVASPHCLRELEHAEKHRKRILPLVRDMRREGPEHPAIAEYFTPYIGLTSELAVRTASEPMALAPAVRQTIQSIDRGGMVLSAKTLDRRLGGLNAARLAQTWLLTAFATVALALAVIGI